MYWLNGGKPLVTGIRPLSKRSDVRQHEGRDAENRIRTDVEGDQQPIVAPYQRVPSGAATVSSIRPAHGARELLAG